MKTQATKAPRRSRGPWGADGYFSAGLGTLLGVGFLVLITSDDKSVAVVVACVGGALVWLFLLIGAIAKGVEAGIRASRD